MVAESAAQASPAAFLEQSGPQDQQSGNAPGVLELIDQAGDVGPDDGIITGPKHRNKRGSVLSLHAEETLQQSDPAAYQKLTQSTWGLFLQGALLVGTVFAYVGNPILVTWAKTVGEDEEGDPIRVTTYMEPLLIFMMKLCMTLIGLTYAFTLDRGNGNWDNLKRIFNREDLIRWNWVALGWTVADVAEQMAGGRLDPALYTVLSQSRLVGTAIMMRFYLGTKRVTLQWSILVNLSLVIIAFRLIGADSKENTTLGFVMTSIKLTLSVVCGVLAQNLLQTHNADQPYIIIITQMTLLASIWFMLLIPFFIFYVAPNLINEPWFDEEGSFYGLFGAPSYCPPPLRECSEEVKIRITSWSWKVLIVLAFNVYRDYTVNYIIKIFDALVKNLCNAFATVVSYAMTVLFLGQEFDQLKGILSAVTAFEIAHYAMAQDMPFPKDESEGGGKATA